MTVIVGFDVTEPTLTLVEGETFDMSLSIKQPQIDQADPEASLPLTLILQRESAASNVSGILIRSFDVGLWSIEFGRLGQLSYLCRHAQGKHGHNSVQSSQGIPQSHTGTRFNHRQVHCISVKIVQFSIKQSGYTTVTQTGTQFNHRQVLYFCENCLVGVQFDTKQPG